LARKNSELIQQRKLQKMVGIFKAVAHPMRLQIVNILMKGEYSVGNLMNMLGAKQSLTSQQLSILKYVGIVKFRRNGNIVFYTIKTESIRKIMEAIIKEIS